MDLSGQITVAVGATAASALAGGGTPVNLSGRISATSSARVSLPGSGPALSGRITVASTARFLRPGGEPFITGQITARVSASTTFQFPGPLLSGRITAISTASFGVPTALSLSGTISATFAAQATFPGGGPFLSGAITTISSASAMRFMLLGSLRGRIGIRTAARTSAQNIGQLDGIITTNLTATVDARFRYRLNGTITTTVTGRAVYPVQLFAGKISTTSAGRAAFPTTLPLSGTISTTSAGGAALQRQAILTGGIAATASARLFGTFPLLVQISGTIAATTSARTDYALTAPVSGVIVTTTGAGTNWTLATYLSGQTHFTVAANGFAGPYVNLLASRSTLQVALTFGTEIGAELVLPLPPYPPPFSTWPVDHYLGLITSEHNQRPNYMATVGMSAEPYVELQTLAAAIPGLFDLDYANGEQEDFTGEWIGKSRWIQLPVDFFSWDYEGFGWNQANWQGPYDTDQLQRLDDYHYRLLLYAAVIANHWDGSIPKAYEAWDTLFAYTGLKVIIQDFGNMTMMYGVLWDQPPDEVLLALFKTGQMDLKPEGIALIDYVFQDAPGVAFFGFDAETDAVSGWDSGAWGNLVPPGLIVASHTEGDENQ